ncbi:MAG: ATP synthase subunit b [Alphaproteobacteria bacterium MarineAlpha5_Bin11]|nr:MAG: ATP synthase subunit b [Alphaproteobacteria bacterium MarineAlpha5_Bin11]PPR52216.1 MAG: ATP synthase subunit b [Alphaproteobacteria bacterium MarineAlpha5_Bin10]|tara:strand:- start:10884 stop:11381 length:498 start_codon:yes stop_codon:yes gene_type:complete
MIAYLLGDAKFWTAVAFVIFIILVFKPIKSILTKSLDDKIGLIKKNIGDAEKIKEDALSLLAETKKRQRNMKDEIFEINRDKISKIENIKKEMNDKLENQLKRRNEVAELKIKQLELEMMSEIKNRTIDLTVFATKKIIKSKLGSRDREQLMDKALKESSVLLKN